jgi:hypothetical protein
MSDSCFMSRDPVVGVETGTWARILDVNGLGLRRTVTFPHDVTWLRGSQARAVLVNGSGRIVEEGSHYCDVSHLLQSLATALDAARRMASENGVGAGPFAVKVLLSVEDRPVLPLPAERWDTSSTPPRWQPAPRDWFAVDDAAALDAWLAQGADRDLDARPETRSLKARPVIADRVAWDSRHEAIVQRATLSEAIAAALAGIPPEETVRIERLVREALSELEPA